MSDREFRDVVQVARASAPGRLLLRAVDAWITAWRWSRLARAISRQWSAIAARPDDARLRLAALGVACAALGQAVGVLVLPRYATSGLPLSWAGSVLFVSLIVAAFPRAFVIAWRDKFGAHQNNRP